MTHPDDHIKFMRLALELAQDGLGRTAPNPSVGCLIVKGGAVVAQACTADGGRPHAETQALEAAGGDKAKGATVYVTLEPCNTHGQTPPCVEALIEAGVAQLVIACRDPFQENHGHGGLERLRDAGIDVVTGVCEADALALNEGFFMTVREKRPFVTAKVATTLDGRIATRTGHSRWITGEEARQKGHELRASHDAVLVGIGTVLADDPLLTVRLPDYDGQQPVRVVIDRDLKIPPDSQLVRTAKESPVWVICRSDAEKDHINILHNANVRVIELEHDEKGRFPVRDILHVLAKEGITRLFVEGGGKTVTGFLQAGMVDRLLWFRAPKLIGGDGLPAFHGLGVDNMNDVFHFTLEDQTRLGEDSLEIWRRKE